MENALTFPPISQLRKFGMVWFLFFVVIAVFPFLQNKPIRQWAFYPAFLFLLASLIYPKMLNLFYKIWLKFGHRMGVINSRIIMFLLFFVIFTPLSILFKILGKDLLKKKMDKSALSYWETKKNISTSMKNQF